MMCWNLCLQAFEAYWDTGAVQQGLKRGTLIQVCGHGLPCSVSNDITLYGLPYSVLMCQCEIAHLLHVKHVYMKK